MRSRPSALTGVASLLLLASHLACQAPEPEAAEPAQPPVQGSPLGSPSPYGVVITGTETPQDRAALLALARDSGAGWVRITAYWAALQDTGTVFNTAELDKLKALVQEARWQGLSVFMSLETSPAWVQLCGQPGVPVDCGDPDYPPHDNFYNAWQIYVANLVDTFSQYPLDVEYWGVWNEPNSREFFKVYPGRDDVTEYGKVLAYAAAEIRSSARVNSANLKRKVVGPDLAQDGAMYNWLSRLLTHYAGHLDVVSVHQYNITECTALDMRLLRDITDRYAKPLWLTEAGWTGPDVQGQTRNIAGVLDEMQDFAPNTSCTWHPLASQAGQRDANWDKTFIYHFYKPSPPKLPQTHLVEQDPWGTWQRRQSFYCLQWYARNKPGAAPANCVRTPGY